MCIVIIHSFWTLKQLFARIFAKSFAHPSKSLSKSITQAEQRSAPHHRRRHAGGACQSLRLRKALRKDRRKAYDYRIYRYFFIWKRYAYVYIYIYIERERETFVYFYRYPLSLFNYIFVYYIVRTNLSCIFIIHSLWTRGLSQGLSRSLSKSRWQAKQRSSPHHRLRHADAACRSPRCRKPLRKHHRKSLHYNVYRHQKRLKIYLYMLLFMQSSFT